MAERIRLSRTRGWRLPAGAINVARPGKLGNPFVVGKWGTRAQCVSALATLAAGFINLGTSDTEVDEQLALWDYIHACRSAFEGRDVACWCSLDGPCHGDVYLHLWNGGSIETLSRFYVDPPRPGIGLMACDLLAMQPLQRDTPGGSGTARKAPGAASSGVAERTAGRPPLSSTGSEQ